MTDLTPPTDALTSLTVDDTFGAAYDDTGSQTGPPMTSATVSQSPSRADHIYAGISGLVIGIVIALAVITAAYIIYELAFAGPEGSAHDISTE